MSAPTRRSTDFEYRVPEDGYERRLYEPSVMQIKSSVHGDDRYVYRKPFPWWSIFLIAAGVYGLFKLIF